MIKKMSIYNIDYSKIEFTERISSGEHVGENSFYMPKFENDDDQYYGYPASDFFGMETKRIIPLSDEEMNAVDW